jgi:hypothetical protein
MIDTSLFPYDTFPIRLEFGEKKDITICHFQCDEHLQKYIIRHRLDKRKIKVLYRDGEPTKSSKTDKKKIRQTVGKSSNGGSSRSKGSTKNMDASANTNRTRKSK